MVVGNHQCKVANLNPSKAQFQLELSLAQFSPSLFHCNFDHFTANFLFVLGIKFLMEMLLM